MINTMRIEVTQRLLLCKRPSCTHTKHPPTSNLPLRIQYSDVALKIQTEGPAKWPLAGLIVDLVGDREVCVYLCMCVCMNMNMHFKAALCYIHRCSQ